MIGQLLNNPFVWELSRLGLDISFGVYQKRFNVMYTWHILGNNPDVLDIGCGIGQYSRITNGRYLGLDLNKRFIAYASRRHDMPNKSFRCQDVASVLDMQQRYDLVLMVDFLHHIADANCVTLLQVASKSARRYVVSFEPITWQPHPIGRWVVEHDRGNHLRSLDSLHYLFQEAGLRIVESRELPLGPINTRAILARPARVLPSEISFS